MSKKSSKTQKEIKGTNQKNRKAPKRTPTISVYTKSGIPLATRISNENKYQEDALEGGFLSAIASFANQSMGGDSFSFGAKGEGSFLIRLSENFIGSILWNDTIDLTKEETEEFLKKLLEQMEIELGGHDVNEHSVQEYLNHYCLEMLC